MAAHLTDATSLEETSLEYEATYKSFTQIFESSSNKSDAMWSSEYLVSTKPGSKACSDNGVFELNSSVASKKIHTIPPM